MRILLDAHTLLWSQDDTTLLSGPARVVLIDPAHVRLLSVATIWEIGIKVALRKLSLSKPFRSWVDTAIADMCLTVLPVSLDHIERQLALPFHHRDPFDRLLVSQALSEGVPLVSRDEIFDAYGADRIWT